MACCMRAPGPAVAIVAQRNASRGSTLINDEDTEIYGNASWGETGALQCAEHLREAEES